MKIFQSIKGIFLCINFLIFSCIHFQIFAQDVYKSLPKRIYTTKHIKTEKPPTIDGKIDEKVWDLVEWQSDFVEWRPDENTPPSHQTKFKILYDDRHLYVAVHNFDAATDSIVSRLTRRDSFEGDWVEINLDSYHDMRTGFSFTSSSSGVKGDEFISENGQNWDESWNPIWYNKSVVVADGWITEIKIPLSQLRFNSDKNQVWGLQMHRRFFRKEERSLWQRVPRDATGWISEMGELHGLENLKPQKQLEIQPFGVFQYDKYPEETGNPYRDGSDLKLNGGLDAKIGITNDLTLDLTVNPDFGQVEADPSQITLDGFQLFFEEQRPFFVENKNIFDYDIGKFGPDNLFYSRRIGRSPQGYPSTTSGEFVKQPTNTTILGAAKFSGKTKSGWSIGLLESVTSNEYAKIAGNGQTRKELVEPLTNYVVGRALKDLNQGNSTIGAIFTATNRQLNDDLSFLHTDAYSMGMDYLHQWKNKKYYITGNFLMSHVKGEEEAIYNTQQSLTHLFQRVDAGHVSLDPTKTSLTGTGVTVEIGKSSVGNITYNLGMMMRSPEFELNDVGFLRKADEIRQYGRIEYQILKPTKTFRQGEVSMDAYSLFDFDGNFNRMHLRIRSFGTLQNFWNIGGGMVYRPQNFSTAILRGGPRFKLSNEQVFFAFVGSDRRKKLHFGTEVEFGNSAQNNFSTMQIDGEINYQPTNAIRISLNPNYSTTKTKTQYVTQQDYNGQTKYITSGLDRETLSASFRLNYTINPNLSIQYYGQPYVTKAKFYDFNYITNPTAKNLNDRFERFDSNQISLDSNAENYLIDQDRNGLTDYEFGKPDFTAVEYLSNLVMRWEYIPGSEIFLVWSQGFSGLGNDEDALFRNLDDQILGSKKDNTFLIKATYRFML